MSKIFPQFDDICSERNAFEKTTLGNVLSIYLHHLYNMQNIDTIIKLPNGLYYKSQIIFTKVVPIT